MFYPKFYFIQVDTHEFQLSNSKLKVNIELIFNNHFEFLKPHLNSYVRVFGCKIRPNGVINFYFKIGDCFIPFTIKESDKRQLLIDNILFI